MNKGNDCNQHLQIGEGLEQEVLAPACAHISEKQIIKPPDYI